jgi:holo-[acyl-carrier protein] synthase
MILGIGNDAVQIPRIERILERFGERFTHRVYTEVERARAEARPSQRAASYAKRFAAKEACSKALGTGLSGGVHWRDMGVTNLASGQPSMRLTGGAGRRLALMTPPGWVARIHVSLTDDHPLALSFVMISAELASNEPESAPGARSA